MSSGGFLDRVLDAIPGYGGYRDKERRRDSDRAIRDHLAVDYTQLADRLGRLANRLADERQIAAIGVVDRPHKRLMSFIDRVRTASYGYAPIFASESVDARALDQIGRFDEALADQTATLETQISEIERADPKSPEFKAAAESITATIQGLDDRFDHRSDVIRTGTALPDKDLVALLERPQVADTPRAFRLHDGEAVAYAGTNYSVIGRVTIESEEGGNWRAFQLAGGTGDQWLMVSSRTVGPVFWLNRVTPVGDPGGPRLTVDTSTYTLVNQFSGDGEVIGKQGSSGRQPVRYYHYTSSPDDGQLHVFRLGSTYLSLVGKTIDPAEVDVFTREQ